MEIEDVSVFVKVVELGSLTAAGRILKMPKTTVSSKLTKLEKKLGVTLIHRTTRRLNVTDEGRIYYQHCAAALAELARAEANLLARRERPQGLLKITAPIDVGHSLLPRIVAEYLDRFPGTEITMLVTNRVVDLIGEGVDLAIRVGHLGDTSHLTRKFFDVDFVFSATPEYLKKFGKPESPEDLVNHEVILYPGDQIRLTHITNGKRTLFFSSKKRLLADEMGTIKALTEQGLGIGWLPNFLVVEEFKNRSLIPLLRDWRIHGANHYAFVYAGHKAQTPNLKEFLKIAQKISEDFIKISHP